MVTKAAIKKATPTDPYALNDRWEQVSKTDEHGEATTSGPQYNRGRAEAILLDLNSGDPVLVAQGRAALSDLPDVTLSYGHSGSVA